MRNITIVLALVLFSLTADAGASRILKFQLMALEQAGGRFVAVIREPSGNQIRVRAGQQVQGWTVETIQQNLLVVAKDNMTVRIRPAYRKVRTPAVSPSPVRSVPDYPSPSPSSISPRRSVPGSTRPSRSTEVDRTCSSPGIMKLEQVVILDGKPLAVISGYRGTVYRLWEGDKIGGFLVEKIELDHVVLRSVYGSRLATTLHMPSASSDSPRKTAVTGEHKTLKVVSPDSPGEKSDMELVGIIQSGAYRIAVIRFGESMPVNLLPGQETNGWKMVFIGDDQVTMRSVHDPGKTRTLRFHSP